MRWFRNSVVFVGSWIVAIGSIFWGITEGGFEPWIVTAGSVVAIAINWELLPLRKKRNLTPEQKIALRDKWRPIFKDYFRRAAIDGHRIGDAIIHDVGRLDTYPNNGDKKGISSWFRVGLMGTYNTGILLGLRWTYIAKKNGEWFEDWKGESEDSVKVMLLGAVPYEAIESINLDGDDYYNKPHVFCHFAYRGEPYERVFFGEEFQLDPGFPYNYREIAEYKRVPRWRFWESASGGGKIA